MKLITDLIALGLMFASLLLDSLAYTYIVEGYGLHPLIVTAAVCVVTVTLVSLSDLNKNRIN